MFKYVLSQTIIRLIGTFQKYKQPEKAQMTFNNADRDVIVIRRKISFLNNTVLNQDFLSDVNNYIILDGLEGDTRTYCQRC